MPSARARRHVAELTCKASEYLEPTRVLLNTLIVKGTEEAPREDVNINLIICLGISSIRGNKVGRGDRYFSMTSVAAFFCGVAASTLQSTFGSTTTKLAQTVNTLFFLSIISSLASAANSIIAMIWERSAV